MLISVIKIKYCLTMTSGKNCVLLNSVQELTEIKEHFLYVYTIN